MKTILVTGGMGYIGSHTVVELIKNGYTPIIVDNLDNSKIEVLNRLETITGVRPTFYQLDVRDEAKLDEVFKAHQIDAVIHFAGLKSVGESCKKPGLYFDNNIRSTSTLMKVMKQNNCKNLVFSSSATVYGLSKKVPFTENDQIGGCTNPYGETKYLIELMLKGLCDLDSELNVALLRYFNPIGAHESGLIGEDPNGIPNNLMPYVSQVASGKLEKVRVFGNDYPTKDGTGVRDYIHVVDLARGHLCALKKLEEKPGLVVYNLGTGHGVSVLELIHAFEKANNLTIPFEIQGRRDGDIATSFADASKAYKELGWKATHTIEDCCRDSWNWQKHNPNGYNK